MSYINLVSYFLSPTTDKLGIIGLIYAYPDL